VSFQIGTKADELFPLPLVRPPSIELSAGSYRLDSSIKHASGNTKTYEFRLKNGDRSAEAIFITFGLYALERYPTD
jgi:hypothetical protein